MVTTKVKAGPINDREIERAWKLAKRAKGVTRAQLAETLGCSVDRAAEILRRAKLTGRPAGQKAGRAARALVFTAR